VPGDYATINGALAAGMTTITLGAQTYSEAVNVSTHTATLTGAGASATSIYSVQTSNGMGLILSGVTVQQGVVLNSGAQPVVITNSTLRSSQSTTFTGQIANQGAALMVDGTSPQSTFVQVSQCDISSGYTGAYAVNVSLAANANVVLQDDTIHDSAGGVNLTAYSLGTAHFALTDDTLNHMSGTALNLTLEQNASGAAISYTGNAITNNGLGVSIYTYNDATTLTHSDNAMVGNTENYGGSAVPDGF